MFAFIQRYLTAGLAFLALTGFFYGGIQTYRLQGLKLKNAEAIQKAQQAARQKEAEWSIIYKETTDAKESQLRAVALERDRFAGELRKRPERLPEAARPACAGATGAELAAPDARFLEGFGSFARSLQIELDACQKREMIGQ